MPMWVCWGCTPPTPRPSASGNAPQELDTSHPFPLGFGAHEPGHAFPALQSTGETAGAFEPQAEARTTTMDELRFAHLSEPETAHHSAASERRRSRSPEADRVVQGPTTEGNVKLSETSDVSSQGRAVVAVGLQNQTRPERKSSRIPTSTVTTLNPPAAPATSVDCNHVPAETVAHTRSERRRGAGSGTSRSRGHPSEVIDDSLFYYKGGWVPVPKRNDDGTPLANDDPKPMLSVGDYVLVREHGRADHGTGTVVATKVDSLLGRFYDVKFIVGRHTVRDVHAHFVDPILSSTGN
jgi:hypothetical protein